jgi:hypothetical protein
VRDRLVMNAVHSALVAPSTPESQAPSMITACSFRS